MQENKTDEEVAALVKAYGHLKVNLAQQEGDSNGEGCWATCASAADSEVYKGGSAGLKFKVVLCNQPIGWPKSWGDVLVATTKGENRPVAYPSDNP